MCAINTNTEMALIVLLLIGAASEVVSEGTCQCKSLNKVIDCSSQSLNKPPSLPSDCSEYTKIDLSNNTLGEIPEALINFEFVNLSQNALHAIQGSYPFDMKTLDVSANEISQIKLESSFRSLENLYAAQNKLTVDYLSGKCDHLQELDVSRNELASLEPVSKCLRLSHLNVSHNKIRDIPEVIHSLTDLQSVDLSHNKLQSLSHLPVSVEILNVSGNSLPRTENTFFAGLQALRHLDLSKNQISAVDEDSFVGLESLEWLDLSGNELGSVPTLVLSVSVQSVSLAENKMEDVSADAVMKLLGTGDADRKVDLRRNNLSSEKPELHALVLRLDSVRAFVDVNSDCSCVNATHGNASLLFCVVDQEPNSTCWVENAKRTTTTTTTPSHETTHETPVIVVVDPTSTTNTSQELNANSTIQPTIQYASHFLTSLGFAKLSFLAFLVLTLVILIVVNCIVGDPVVDERWWEEKLRVVQ